MNLLLVEDDPELARQMFVWLEGAGHSLQWKERAVDALQAVAVGRYDAMILDVGLPDMDGFKVVQYLRSAGQRLPVLFLTARDSVTDRVRGLTVGGDDYLTKPFAIEELMARLEALHRRSAQAAGVPQRLGRWTLDSTLRRLRDGNEVVELQPREWTLLEVFMGSGGRVLTKKYLLEKVWDIHFDPGTNVVDAMICKLRRKLDEGGESSYIRTVRGKGYVFEDLPR